MAQLLGDASADWKKREATLKRFAMTLPTGAAEPVEALNHYPHGIALQLSDLRSSLVKLASEAVQGLASARGRLRAAPDRFIDQFLKSEEMHRALASANKVIANHAADAVTALARAGLIGPAAMIALNAAALESKSPQLRERVSQLLLDCLEAGQRLGGFRPTPEQGESLRRAAELFTSDAGGKTRQCGRTAAQLLGRPEAAPRAREANPPISSPRPHSARASPACTPQKQPAPRTRLEFRALLREYQSAADEGRRSQLRQRLERTELARFGSQFLGSVLAESPLPDWLGAAALREFPLAAFVEHFRAENSPASLGHLRRKMGEGPQMDAGVAAELVERLTQNATDSGLSADFQHECAALLEESFAAAKSRARPITTVRLPVSTPTKKLVQSPTLEVGNCDEVISLIEKLRLKPQGVPRAKLATVMRMIADLARTGQPIESSLEALLQLAPRSEEHLHALFEIVLTAFMAAKGSRDALVRQLLELPCKAGLVGWLLHKLAAPASDGQSLASVLRFFAALLRLSHVVYEGAELEEALWPHIDHLARLAHHRLICHSEVSVRKNTVNLLVEAQRFLPADVFAEVMAYFSPEQQKLVQHFIAF